MIPALASLISALGSAGGAASAFGASNVATGLLGMQKALKDVDTVIRPVTQGLDKAGQSLKSAGAAATQVAAQPLKLLTEGIEAINAPALATVAALTRLQNAITAVGKAITPFVALASPGTTTQFQRASSDLTASIGRALTPALEMATKFVRAFADVIFVVSGPINRLTRAFQPLADLLPKAADALAPVTRRFEDIANLLIEIVRPLADVGASHAGEVLHRIAGTLETVYRATKPLIEVMTEMARVFGQLYRVAAQNPFGRVLRNGLFNTSAVPEAGAISGRSVGAAVAPTQIGSVEGALSQAVRSSFSIGSASGIKPEERTATTLDKVYLLLSSWNRVFDEVPERIASAIVNSPRRAAETIGSVAREAPIASSVVAGPAVALAAKWAAENFSFGGR